MKLGLAVARTLLLTAGYKTAAKWDAAKCTEKLPTVSEHLEAADFGEDEYSAKKAKAVVKAIADKEAIEVTDDPAPAAAADDEAPPPKPKAKPAPVEGDDEPAAPAKTKKTTTAGGAGKTTTKAEKPAKPAAEKKAPAAPAMPGVRNSRSRPYLAGIIIKKAGRDAGITEAMVKELDTAYGKENPNESLFCLRNAWHAIRGFVTKNNEGDLTQEGLENAPAEAAE